MAKRLIWSVRAKSDLIAILIFWNENNQSDHYSKKLTKRINDLLLVICENNFLGKPTTTNNVRITICDSYLIIYEILDSAILVLTIFDGRRDPHKLTFK